MLKFSTVLLLLSILNISEAQKKENDLTKLTLSTGAIRGRKFVTAKNTTAYLFHGIPYAEPPIGDLRFRAPINKKKWEGELKADDYNAMCLSTFTENTTQISPRNMSEDCLHANVFTTKNCLREKNCPVMYYIFGGGWNSGSPFDFPEWLLVDSYQSKDIVLITITYRMGFFGFFNTVKRTSAVKNLGMLDLIHGLHWAQREIHNFGGDKNRVSIMGHSSGAQGTDLLSLSPKTDGLFHQVIPMSGPAGLSPYLSDTNADASKAMAVATGCATEDLWNAGNSFENIITCLRNKSADELLSILKTVEASGKQFSSPVMDEPDGVLPESLEVLLNKRRPYRLLIGTTNKEYRISKFLFNEDGEVNEPLLYATCVMMAKNEGFKHAIAVGRACADDYSKRPSDIADLIDDIIFYVSTYDSGEAMRRKGATVYKYSFEYDQIGEAFGNGWRTPGMESPFHAEDLVYVMGLGYGTFTAKDEKINQIYSGMFADFIKTGDPSPPNNEKWQPSDDRNNYFLIDFDDNVNMPGNVNGYHASAIKFWTKTAPELDKFFSKWDVNGTFSFKKLAQDLIRGLKEMRINIGREIEEEIEQWKDDLHGWKKERVDRLEKVISDLWNRIQSAGANDKLKRNHPNHSDENDPRQSAVVEQHMKQMVHQILPSVRNETATIGAKDSDWKMWFWVATGVCVLLAVILLLTCCTSCYQNSKRRQYERLNESTALNPSSAKTYG